MKRRVLILGAAGRDFHNFNVVFRKDPETEVVAFTVTQIPNIEGRRYPAELAGPNYPEGIPIYSQDDLEKVIREKQVDAVVFSYSDISHVEVMHLASRVVAAGASFELLPTNQTMLPAGVPVVSICAVRTGCGKSPVSRRVASVLHQLGWKFVVVRHPMPYGNLVEQRVQRFATYEDLERYDCTIEEREEYEPHLSRGTIVYAGVDYEAILRQAEQESDLIVWDGGNNDTPFFKPDLEIVVADAQRPGHEITYFPGEVNLLRAHVVVLNKIEGADPKAVQTVRRNVASRNPSATVIDADLPVFVKEPEQIAGKQVLVIEDGPTLTHGDMSTGAGIVAAKKFGAAEIVDPRPYAVGSIATTYKKYPHIGPLIPAMGYGKKQMRELEQTISKTPCDLVLVATPVDLVSLLKLKKPALRVTYEVEELTHPNLQEILEAFTQRVRPVAPLPLGGTSRDEKPQTSGGAR